MITVFYAVVTIIGIAIHLFVRRRSLDAAKALEIMLIWCFAVLVGLGSVVGSGFHVFDAAATARMIGWAPGSPFQFENAMGGFAVGVLGFLCIRFRGLFWLATTIQFSIMWLGDAYGHIYEMVVHHDYAPYNTGVLLATDIVFPLVIVLLLIMYHLIARRHTPAVAPSTSPATSA